MTKKVVMKIIALVCICHAANLKHFESSPRQDPKLGNSSTAQPDQKPVLSKEVGNIETTKSIEVPITRNTTDKVDASKSRKLHLSSKPKSVLFWKKVGSKASSHNSKRARMMKLNKVDKIARKKTEKIINQYLRNPKPMQKKIKAQIGSFVNIFKKMARRKKVRKQARKNQQISHRRHKHSI